MSEHGRHDRTGPRYALANVAARGGPVIAAALAAKRWGQAPFVHSQVILSMTEQIKKKLPLSGRHTESEMETILRTYEQQVALDQQAADPQWKTVLMANSVRHHEALAAMTAFFAADPFVDFQSATLPPGLEAVASAGELQRLARRLSSIGTDSTVLDPAVSEEDVSAGGGDSGGDGESAEAGAGAAAARSKALTVEQAEAPLAGQALGGWGRSS